MDKKIIILVFAILLLVPSVIAATYVVFDYGNSDFDVAESEKVISNSIIIENASLGCQVSLNGDNQGDCDFVTSLDVGDFRDSWVYDGGWDWRGDNQITFSEDIDNFTLTYNTGDIDGDEGEYCKWDRDCSGDCVYSECCSHVTNAGPPIDFVAPILSSCPDSSIPIETIMNCGDRDDSDYKNVDILFYLNGVKLTPGNAIVGEECTVEAGVTGWDLDGAYRCGANIDVETGTYDLTARYTLDEDFYDVAVASIEVLSECGTNIGCGHSGSATNSEAVYYNNPSVGITGEMKINPVDEGYLVAPGTEMIVNGISAFNIQCSNGVSYGIRQGFVAWSGNDIFDSLISCNILGVTRDSLVGDSAGVSTIGYKPSGCNLALTQSQGTEVTLGTFTTPGNHNVKMDMVNAICDAPDYICPDLTLSNPNRASLCKIGTMASPWQRADGWVPLEEYDFKVINPDITFTKSSQSQDGIYFSVTYDASNVGIGIVNITSVGITNSLNFSASCSNCPMLIEEGETRQVIIDGVMNTTEVLSQVPFSDLPFAEECDDDGSISFYFEMDVSMEYDDGYGFITLLPRTETRLLDLDFEFDCDPNFPDIDVSDIACGNFFNITETFGFNVSVEHEDGLIRGYIDYGDGSRDTTIINGPNRYIHEYSVPGNYQILVFVEDLRGAFQKKRTNIMVIDPDKTADYAAACIDKPEDLSNIPWSNVEFDASSSMGLRCPGGGGECTFVDVTGLWFTWRFSDNTFNFNHDGGLTELAYKFYKNYITAGHNWAELDVRMK